MHLFENAARLMLDDRAPSGLLGPGEQCAVFELEAD